MKVSLEQRESEEKEDVVLEVKIILMA